MALATIELTRSREAGSFVAELYRREPVFTAAGFLMIAIMAPTLFALAVETRTLDGANLWIKPLKFEISLAVYFLTLAWFARWLPEGTLGDFRYRAFAGIVAAGAVLEMIWIGGAAALGTASHFNEATLLSTTLYGAMGMVAVLITSASLVYGVLIARNRQAGLSAPIKEALVHGLVLTFVLTLATAGYMSSSGGHFVGEVAGASRVPFFGWARDGGDLRVPHFFATHAMQVVPAFGFFCAAVLGLRSATPVRLFSVAFAAFTAFVFVQALAGRPFLG